MILVNRHTEAVIEDPKFYRDGAVIGWLTTADGERLPDSVYLSPEVASNDWVAKMVGSRGTGRQRAYDELKPYGYSYEELTMLTDDELDMLCKITLDNWEER